MNTNNNHKKSKIFIAGHTGLVGSAIYSELKSIMDMIIFRWKKTS